MNEQVAVLRQTGAWLKKSVLRSAIQLYVEHLIGRGYARSTVRVYACCVGHFAYWLRNQRIRLDQIDETVIRRFLYKHLPSCKCPDPVRRTRYELRAALNQLLIMLRATALVPPRTVTVGSIEDELQRFQSYLDKDCGFTPVTRYQRVLIARKFLESSFGHSLIEVSRLKPQAIYRFVIACLKRWKPSSGGAIGVALRCYLRYRALRGDNVQSLIAAVPAVAAWRLSGLPEPLSTRELSQFLNSFDRSSASSRRGYAMARCLTDLGLRANEVIHLQLDDLDWREGTLRLAKNKSRRMDILPLPVLTGQAIAEYIKFARPKTETRILFVRLRAPREEPIATGCVHRTVQQALDRCGLNRSGTHLLRHSVASRLLQAGTSLKEIADILRHRSIDTTAIYTKVDLHGLSAVAMPWPGTEA
jgi:site-specific recombinase XerD